MKLFVHFPSGNIIEDNAWIDRVTGMICPVRYFMEIVGHHKGKTIAVLTHNAENSINHDHEIISQFVKDFYDDGFEDQIVIK